MNAEPDNLPFLDPEFKARSPILCRQLAGDGSLIRVRLPSDLGAWITVSHNLARSLLRDARLIKQPIGITSSTKSLHPIFRHMLALDPPEHTRLRAALSAAMPPERVRMLRPEVEAVTQNLVTKLSAYGMEPFDILAELALPLPVKVITQLLGIPSEDQALIQEWSLSLLQADLDKPDRTNAIADDIDAYLRILIAEKQRAPDDSVMSFLVHAKKQESLSTEEISAMGFLLLTAGHETSANLIANGVLSLLRTPSTWRQLSMDPSIAGATIEEVLRFESPLEFSTLRYAAEDIVIEGQTICRGDLVFVGLGAANRDPFVFSKPNVFDIDRNNNARHVSFGQGVHACPGAHLARLEGEVALSALARHFPSLELATVPETLQWIPGLVMRGLASLPVRAGNQHEAKPS